MVTMVWVVSRIRLKVETSSTRSQKSTTMIELTRDLLAGGDLITLGSLQVTSQRASTSAHRVPSTLTAD